MDLFSTSQSKLEGPLANKLRPHSLDEVQGQDAVIGESTPLGTLLREGLLQNLIVCGPPGTGKTSFAKSLAAHLKAEFIELNAVDTGAKALKEVGEAGRNRRLERQEKTLVFLDEIHRLNKAQQDVLLPFIEKGDLYLIGATTENPNYELNRALLSRCRVIHFQRLSKQHLLNLAGKAVKLEMENLELKDFFSEESLQNLVDFADGDGRRLLNLLEITFVIYKSKKFSQLFPLQKENLNLVFGETTLGYDKSSDQHYDCISAFIKSVRGSDVDAAIYYLARMIEGGEDPVFIARRLIILASEDIGNAEPRALPLATAGLQAVEAIGMPEARIVLAQVTSFMASCPKSNASYNAINSALEFVKQTGTLDVPLHLRSSQKGGDYKYPHFHPRGWVKQDYLPNPYEDKKFYSPPEHGFEKTLKEYLKWLKG